MIINLNGGLSMNGSDYYFDELEIEIIEDEFDCDIEEYEMDCDECGFCDLDCDDCELEDEDFEDDLDDNVDALLEMYADILGEGYCHEHIRVILLDLIKDFVDILVE